MTKFSTLFLCLLLAIANSHAAKKEKHHKPDGCCNQYCSSALGYEKNGCCDHNKDGCCDQYYCVSTLKVEKDACIGCTLTAENICTTTLVAKNACIQQLDVADVRVKCCENDICLQNGTSSSSSVVIACEKCVNNVRGVVKLNTNVSLEEFNPNGVTPSTATVEAGCGFSIMPDSAQLTSLNITQQYRRIGQIWAYGSAARSAMLSFRVCLDQPCCSRAAVTSTTEVEAGVNNMFANVVSPTVLDLSGKENIFHPGTFFPAETYVATEAAEVVINKVNDSCFTLNNIFSLVAGSDNDQLANEAISQVQLATMSSVVNPNSNGIKFNFVEQCPIKCCEDTEQ